MKDEIKKFNEIIKRYDSAIYNIKDENEAIKCGYELEALLFPYVSDINIIKRFEEKRIKALETKEFTHIIRWIGSLINLSTDLEFMYEPIEWKKYKNDNNNERY